MLVLLTYGRQDSDAAVDFARKLEQTGVKILVVGFGYPDPIVLMKIAGAITLHADGTMTPDHPEKANNVFLVRESNKVDSVAERVAETVCKI